MNHQELHWQTADGLEIFGRCWQPDAEIRAVVCLVHGLGEHSGRYAHVAAALTAAGYALLGFDLRGHGRSAGLRGHTPSYKALLDDIALLLEQAERYFPGRPRFLYGHSLGGNLVLNYALRRRPQLAGVVATGPWLRLAFEPSRVQVLLARTMDRLWPAFSQANGLEVTALARDPAVVQAYQDDPLVHDRVSARLFAVCYSAGLWALAHASEFPLPLLLMHGSADRLTSAAASQEFANRAPDCTFQLWDGFYHELHNEPEKDAVLARMLDWLGQRLSRR